MAEAAVEWMAGTWEAVEAWGMAEERAWVNQVATREAKEGRAAVAGYAEMEVERAEPAAEVRREKAVIEVAVAPSVAVAAPMVMAAGTED